MKRFILTTIMLAAVAVATKLALKPASPHRSAAPAGSAATPPTADVGPGEAAHPAALDDEQLLARFSDDHELVAGLLERFGHNARRMAARDGLRGLRLLDALGDAAVCLYEERPSEFHQLCSAAPEAEAARLIGAWGRYFDPRCADRATTELLARDLNRLPPRIRRLAQQTPEALPFLLAEPGRTAELVERLGVATFEPLAFVDLSDGGESLRHALDVLDRHGKLALAAWDEAGLAGFLLVGRYGDLVRQTEPELDLRDTLAVTAAAAADLDELLETRRGSAIAEALAHLRTRGLLAAVAGNRYALRLAVEFAEDGERAMQAAGPRVAQVIYERYPAGVLRNAAVQAVSRAGVPAAAALEQFADSAEFRRIVARHGAAAILAVAASNSAEENRAFLAAKPSRTWGEALALGALRLSADSGEKTILVIARDGIERAESLADGAVEFYQLLPLYDLSHLGVVAAKGQLPTKGEFVWAGIDASLVAFDALSLLAFQPEGAAAGETVRSGAKSAAKASLKSTSHAVAERTAESLAERLATNTAGETAGQFGRQALAGTGRVAEQASAELTTLLARRSGIRLVQWQAPGFVRAAAETLAGLPFHRGTKYVAMNVTQAGVGVLAVHKMEEYLASRKAAEAKASGSQARSGDQSNEDI